MKFSFKNDYSEGCHPLILEALLATNSTQEPGYGLDQYSLQAEKLIVEKIQNSGSKVYFVSGGTQANLICMSAFLKSHESIISAETGHIFNNEAGAIEATGHKIHTAHTIDGKLRPSDIEGIRLAHQNIPHQLKPKLVYISNSTETGTVYLRDELIALSNYCKAHNLFLFMDGARLAQALTSVQNDLQLADIGKYTDAFYIGGTKNGALLGEAIVINNQSLQVDFPYHIKQRGALLAKGRLLGIQFLTLMQDNLYFELGKKANELAMTIKAAFEENGFEFFYETHTNQIFPILTYDEIQILEKKFEFYVWKKIDEHRAAIRMITSWATREDAVHELISMIRSLKS